MCGPHKMTGQFQKTQFHSRVFKKFGISDERFLKTYSESKTLQEVAEQLDVPVTFVHARLTQLRYRRPTVDIPAILPYVAPLKTPKLPRGEQMAKKAKAVQVAASEQDNENDVVTAAELDAVRARAADIRGKIKTLEADLAGEEKDLADLTQKFLEQNNLSHLLRSTAAAAPRASKNGTGKSLRWRKTLVAVLLAERPDGWAKDELLDEMKKRRPGANTDKLDTYLKDVATERGGRFVAKKAK